MSGPRPPRWLETVVERVVPEGLPGQGVLGDLTEEYRRRAIHSVFRARLWYARQTLSIVAYGVLLARPDAEDTHTRSDVSLDVRWALRLVRRHPGFAAGVVAVLGLGLGATVAVFSVVAGTFQNTSWWDEPDRAVAVWPERKWSFGMIELYREEQSVYRSLGGYVELAFALGTPDGGSESVNGVFISPELFRELAVQPGLGRSLRDEDALLGVEPVVVLGEALWRRSFGGDPDVVGRVVDVGGESVRVVGVQGVGGRAPGGRAEVWLPLVVDPREDDYFKQVDLKAVGVLADGATMADAYDDVDAFGDYLVRLFPTFFRPDWQEGLVRVARADASQRRLVSTPLLLLLGGSGLLLLVTALNVGNLLLGRAIERRTELAVRSAIGAGRRRIVQQLLVEAAVLTALAVGVGLLVGAYGGPWIAQLFVGEAVVASVAILTPAVLAFAGAVAVGAWLVLGGVPVLHFLRGRASGLALAPRSGARGQRFLVAIQAALATLLLVSATLLVATVGNLRDVPLGFDDAGLLTVDLSPPEDRVADPATARELYDRLAERIRGLPGVEAVGLTGWLPLAAQAPTAPLNLEAAPVHQAEARSAPMHKVDRGFFEVMGLEAVEGRLLGTEDRADGIRAVVVSESLAREVWPDRSPVGQRVAIDPHMWNTFVPVVGVVPDIRTGDLTGPPTGVVYAALAEGPTRDVTLVVRTAGGGEETVSAVRRSVSDVDPLVPVRSVAWMGDVVRAAYSIAWVVMGLLVALAALATALGAIGIYAALTQQVAATRREIGVRMALGADPGRVVGEVVRSGLLVTVAGIAGGSVVAALSVRVLDSLLFGVSPLTPWAYAAPAAALCAAALVAGCVPAFRAGRLPPAEVLREE
ncbi:MAG: ABC transporter permease [Gemmatimonadota bacterium]|jgi:predicted permease